MAGLYLGGHLHEGLAREAVNPGARHDEGKQSRSSRGSARSYVGYLDRVLINDASLLLLGVDVTVG